MAQTIDNQAMTQRVQTFLDASTRQSSEASQRISSGLRVNSAKDDAAGLAIAERMTSLVQELNTSIRNAYDGVSMTQVADGGLEQVSDQLQRMRELAVQSANGTYTAEDRQNLNAEFSALNEEVSRIASTTTFNGQTVLANDGESVDFQVGGAAGDGGTISVDLVGIESLNTDISTADASQASLTSIDALIANVSSARSEFGAVQNRFESTINNLQTNAENQSAARGRIMDADFAVETANLAGAQITQSSATAMAAQANVSSQNVARLLG